MGFFGRLLGIDNDEADRRRSPRDMIGSGPRPALDPDAQAIERYRYMLRTAPPETLEQAHAEAFAKLTPEQRRQVLAELTSAAPPNERAAIAATPIEDAQALGRVATRAEIRQPGLMERTLGAGGGMGFGASLLSSFAMGFVGSMVANSFFSALGGAFDGGYEAEHDGSAEADEGALADHDEDASAGDDYADDGDFGGGGDFEV
jgi:hypothetical protein